jgi:excisionase family DNA binding protein
MKFSKDVQLNQSLPDTVPPITTPVPMHPKNETKLDASERLADVKMVARRLGVSPRFVQTLVRRKAIPVIRLGRRCIRFDLSSVLTAVKTFESGAVES